MLVSDVLDYLLIIFFERVECLDAQAVDKGE